MKANKLQRAIIMVRSLWTTFWISSKVLLKNTFGTMTREWFDRQRIIWGSRMLSYPQVSYTIHNPLNVEIEPQHSYVVMSNHASHYDIPLLFLTFPKGLRMIAKKELFKVPIWGAAMKAGEIMVVDRDDRRQAIRDLAIAKEKMATGIMPWIAPEGTRTRTGELLPFKKGGFMIAMETGATIIPVGLKGSGAILPPDTWDFNIKEHVDIYIGKPIDTRNYTRKQRDELMQDVETSIRSLLGQAQA
jgi:1-acyl-sn-glycerol-3-phosphate acyltransferase